MAVGSIGWKIYVEFPGGAYRSCGCIPADYYRFPPTEIRDTGLVATRHHVRLFGLAVGISVFPGLDILVRYPFIVNGIDQPTAIRYGNSMANALFLRASSHIRTCMKALPRATA